MPALYDFNRILNTLIITTICRRTGLHKCYYYGIISLKRIDVESYYHVTFNDNSWNMFAHIFSDRLRPIAAFNIDEGLIFQCHPDQLNILWGYGSGFGYISEPAPQQQIND